MNHLTYGASRPRDPQDNKPDDESAFVTGEQDSPLILVVEDDRDTAEMLCVLLEEEGYGVVLSSNAHSVLAHLKGDGARPRLTPDAMLLDLTMPDFDPVEMVRQLKPGEQPPIIILSARTEEAVRSIADNIGAAGFVRKPFTIDELLSSIRQVLK
jgi:DNA-binding response OmpR family regulator